jgi:hypothetical protein
VKLEVGLESRVIEARYKVIVACKMYRFCVNTILGFVIGFIKKTQMKFGGQVELWLKIIVSIPYFYPLVKENIKPRAFFCMVYLVLRFFIA